MSSDADSWRDHVMRGAEVAARIDKRVAAALDALPRSRPEKRALLALRRLTGKTDRHVRHDIEMTSPQFSRTMAGLVDAGLVSTTASPSHGRQRCLYLTPAGEAEAAVLAAARRAAFDTALASMRPEDRTLIQSMAQQQGLHAIDSNPDIRAATYSDSVAAFALMMQAAGSLKGGRHLHLARLATEMAAHFRRAPPDAECAGFVAVTGAIGIEAFCLMTSGSTCVDATSDSAAMMMHGPYVQPRARRNGLATRLLTACINVAEGATYSSISTRVSDRDKDLIALLVAHRFVRSRDTDEVDPYGVKETWSVYTRLLSGEVRDATV